MILFFSCHIVSPQTGGWVTSLSKARTELGLSMAVGLPRFLSSILAWDFPNNNHPLFGVPHGHGNPHTYVYIYIYTYIYIITNIIQCYSIIKHPIKFPIYIHGNLHVALKWLRPCYVNACALRGCCRCCASGHRTLRGGRGEGHSHCGRRASNERGRTGDDSVTI